MLSRYIRSWGGYKFHIGLNLPPKDNLWKEDKRSAPKVSFIRMFHCRMLMSVEIVSGCKVLKVWGVHQVSEIVNLGDSYCGITAGTVESSSSFWMPPELQDQLFVCSIGKSQNGPFQDCPSSITAGDAIDFAGKFIWYRVELSDTHQATSITATRGSPDAFSVLMSSQQEIPIRPAGI